MKPHNKALQTDKVKLSCLLHSQEPRRLAFAAELIVSGAPVNIEIRRAGGPEALELTTIAFAAKRQWGYPEDWIELWADKLTVDSRCVEENWSLPGDQQQITGPLAERNPVWQLSVTQTPRATRRIAQPTA